MTAVLDQERVEENTDDLVDVDAEALLRGIHRNCFILGVTVRCWNGHYLVRDSDVKINNVAMDTELLTAPQWKLMPAEWHKKLQPFVSGTRSAVQRVGVPFKAGVYLVPKTRAAELMRAVGELRAEYRQVATEFAGEWPAIRAGLQERITREASAAQWAALSKKIPKAEDILRLFDIETSLWPVGSREPEAVLRHLETLQRAVDAVPANAIRREVRDLVEAVTALLADASSATRAVIDDHIDEWLVEAQTTTSRLVAAAVNSMIEEPLQEFAAAVQNLEDLRAREGVCRSGTIDAIRRAYEKLMGFSFMVSDDMRERLQQVRIGLDELQPRDVNDQSASAAAITASLRGITEDLRREDEESRGVRRMTRFLDLS